MDVLEHLGFFQAHLFALLAEQFVQSFLDTDLRLAPQVLRVKLRSLLKLDHADVAMLALERTAKRQVHSLDTLLEFLVTPAILAAVELFKVHFHAHLFAHGLQLAQILNRRPELDRRLINIVPHLEVDKRIQHRI